LKLHTFKCWAPLVNFGSESSHIEFSKDIKIRKLTSSEKQILKDLLSKWSNIKYDEFAIEYLLHKEVPESVPQAFLKDGRKEIEKCLTTLRLFKEGILGYNLIVQTNGKDSHIHAAITLKHYELYMGLNTEYSQKKYEIAANEEKNLISLFTEFDTNAFQQLELAIHYFNKSYIEPYTPRDSLVDLIISLESVFLKGESQELGYKLRIRMAILLAETIEKRKEIFDDIKRAYNRRGVIVHGEKNPDIDYNYLFKIREYARKSLIIFLKNPELRNQLDEFVLNGKSIA
jgi:hypothetical protein